MQLVPVPDINRMEAPRSDWADQEGLKCGYGLGNDCIQHGGFTYHGHDGQIEGGFAEFSYLAEDGVGYFYSINSGNGIAFQRIGQAIRAYITLGLPKPSLPSVVPLPANVAKYSGWYVSDSPQLESTRFLEELFRLTRVRFHDGKMIISDLRESGTFLPAGDEQFRYVPMLDLPEPEATAILLRRKENSTFIQGGTIYTLKRIPTWVVAARITISGIVVLAIISVFPYSLTWISAGLSKRGQRLALRPIEVWPFVAMLSLFAIPAIFYVCHEDLIERLGQLTPWSAGIWLSSVFFAVASLASSWTTLRARRDEVPQGVRIYSTIVATALLLATGFLAYWGIIGLRTWS